MFEQIGIEQKRSLISRSDFLIDSHGSEIAVIGGNQRKTNTVRFLEKRLGSPVMQVTVINSFDLKFPQHVQNGIFPLGGGDHGIVGKTKDLGGKALLLLRLLL